jgi:transcription elongation factor GreA
MKYTAPVERTDTPCLRPAPIRRLCRSRSSVCDNQRESSILEPESETARFNSRGRLADALAMIDITDKIKKKLKDEIAALEHELHNELPKEIKVARAHGDLSENAEYKYAKERQAYVSARLGQLHQRMADISMMNLNNLPKDRAAYGSRIVVLDVAKDAKVEYKLVTPEEADASNGLISTSSPIGRALLGKKVGDEVSVATPAGVKEYEIVRLTTIHDQD